MTLPDILRDSNYKLTQFSTLQIRHLEESIVIKEIRGKDTAYINCLVRKKEIKLTPEEAIRQLYVLVLRDDFSYSTNRMELEYAVSFGREKKRADIVIFDRQQTTAPYIMVELKKPKLKDGKEQLKSYCNATGAPIGIWSNGDSISYYHRKDPNYFEDIPGIPRADQKLSDILEERWTIQDLINKDKLVTERKSLKDLILEMEDEVLANAGVDVFEELFKLIFTKLFDEMQSGKIQSRHLEFRNYGDTETELKTKIQNLFDKAKQKWEGVFTEDAKLMLTPSHLSVCVSSLQDVKLFNSNLDVVDEAFEYLINKSSKGEKGQYFTPRYVIDMCVKMLNPKESETIIDTAAGSCGFPVHTIFHVWEQILIRKGLNKSHLFTLEDKPQECTDYVQDKVFAIDFDEKAVRVGRTLNLIAGDGQTNVLHLNTLDYERWDEKIEDEDWIDIYNIGWKKLKKLREEKNSNRDFEFDILMANPPFAGDIKESRILAKYELGKKDSGKYQSAVGRDILFIERNLDFLKPGGRMAVVLPQGRFNNSSDKQIREFIAEHCRILAVVGLHGNVFKPHTNTKTSVLFVQKWDDELCPKVDDYPIFFATMQEPSKDNSGEKIFVRKKDFPKSAKKEEGVNLVAEPVDHYDETPKDLEEYLLDTHGHLIVKHDLFNHDGLTKDGIAEAFIEFGKKEKLSFFRTQSEALLIELTYMKVHHSKKEFFNIKNFKDSFLISGRIDAEYYQKKFDDLESKIMQTGQGMKLGSVLSTNKRGTQPVYVEDGTRIPVLNSKHIRENRIDFSDNRLGDSASTKPELHIRKNDVLINGTGVGTIGRCAVYMKDEPALPDNHVTILRTEGIDPVFLSVMLNSVIGKMQVEKYFKGSSGQIELYPADINEFIIWNAPEPLQKLIRAKIEEAENLRNQSMHLLEVAKRAVEIALEQDEETALKFINNN